MKIAMIGLRGIPGVTGGVETVIENLAPLLVKLGADVTVYCRNTYCGQRLESFRGVKLRYLPTINTKHTESLSHTFLATLDAMFRDYDIIHYHAMGNALFSFIPRIISKKTVVTIHGLDWEREKWGTVATLYLKACENIINTFPNRVISVSSKIKRYYYDKYRKVIDFIPNGVNLIDKKDMLNLKGLEKGKYILFMSRIVPEKGVHFLIDAFRKIDTDMKLVIAGGATHTDAYVKNVMERTRGDDRIIFTGALELYSDKWREAFSNAAFFVLPSTIEGMPVVLLEAMSFGLYPLVSDIQENLDVIGDLGASFRSKDIDDLRRKLEHLINNSDELEEKGKHCKEMVKEEYRWPTIAEKTYDIYKNLKDEKL